MLLFCKCQEDKNTTKTQDQNDDEICPEIDSTSFEICDSKIGEDEKKDGNHCCLLKGTKDNISISKCIILDGESYRGISDFLEDLKSDGMVSPSIDCGENNDDKNKNSDDPNSQSNIKFNSFFLILLFLLFN